MDMSVVHVGKIAGTLSIEQLRTQNRAKVIFLKIGIFQTRWDPDPLIILIILDII